MSKHNKVNPGQYHVAGRLTPDEAARERVKQRNVARRRTRHLRRRLDPARAPVCATRTPRRLRRVEAKPRTRAAGRSRG